MTKLERYAIYLICPILLLAVFFSLSSQVEQNKWFCIPVTIIALLLIYLELFILPNKRQRSIFWSFWVFCFSLISIFIFIGERKVYDCLYLVLLFALMRYCGVRIALVGVVAEIGMIGIALYFKEGLSYIYFKELISICQIYGGALVVMGGLRYMILQNNSLIEAKKQLTERNIHLSQTYNQLKRAYDQLEEYTIIKERNHMSREMHDTVGHTLTTSLVELEVCKMMSKDNSPLFEKLEHISTQIRSGLGDLRITVRRLKDDLDWEQEITAIGERLMSHTDIKVITQVEDLHGTSVAVLRCVYRIIQEGITNGIKHGGATAFMIQVKHKDKALQIEVMDNGKGAIGFKEGFGLTAMRERVEALNGELIFESYKEEGFTIKAILPGIQLEGEKQND